MIRRLTLASLWFLITPILLLAIAVKFGLQNPGQVKSATVYSPILLESYETKQIEGQIIPTKIDDARPYILERFLKGRPLEPYSGYIVEVSDKYGIDYRLIPAIAMKESGAGAAIDPASHNAWGFENGKTYFSSWEYAIDRVGYTLKTGYISQGLTTPEEIMVKYAPPQVELGGKWAKDVRYFMEQMETL